MRLVVVSHKPCWPSARAASGYATDGGFPMQMGALSQLFDATTLLVPCAEPDQRAGEVPLGGHNLSVVPLTAPDGTDGGRKLRLPAWLARNLLPLFRQIRRADAVHIPIPGDVGTFGLLLAQALRKPLFVRHCGNWQVQQTAAEHFWRWLLERSAGGKTVVLATGGAEAPPSVRNPDVGWIFSTSMTAAELARCGSPRGVLPRHGPRLIIACRQEREKGTGVVIASLPLLMEQFPDVHLDVVGDGSGLTEFKALAERIGVAHRVAFHGKVSHDAVVSLLAEADLFCFPTWSSEGFPKAVLEAMACGLPVVTTRVSVLPQLLGAGGGTLIAEPTADAVAGGVRQCLASDERYRSMSRAAVATVRGYSLERWRDTIGELLESRWGSLRSET